MTVFRHLDQRNDGGSLRFLTMTKIPKNDNHLSQAISKLVFKGLTLDADSKKGGRHHVKGFKKTATQIVEG